MEENLARLEARGRAKTPMTQSRNTLWNLITFGVIIQFVGGSAIGVGTQVSDDAAVLILALAGWSLISLGSSMLLVGLVGWAVLLGLRAHSEESA